MNHPVVEQHEQSAILYDPRWSGKISSDWFRPHFWQNAHATAEGRGASYFISHDHQQWVLRHYQRGGLVAKLLSDQYIWTGLAQTRPWREWRLLDKMQAMSLPVPVPVAARVQRRGIFYYGDILIERIADAIPLSQILQSNNLTKSQWQKIGRCIRQFHLQGIYHADLNAHNILMRADEVFLIDFDKGEQRTVGGSWCQANLKRLQRSLIKLANQYPCFAFSTEDGLSLLEGYTQ